MRRVSIQGVSGAGKSTTGRALAALLEVPYLELDAVVHGPNWVEASPAEVKERVDALLAEPGWVIDGRYRNLLGETVFEQADTIVWLDLPVRTWLPHLLRRTLRRMIMREELWNGNREQLRHLFERPNIFEWAFRKHFSERRDLPARAARFEHAQLVRLRSTHEVVTFLRSVRENHGT